MITSIVEGLGIFSRASSEKLPLRWNCYTRLVIIMQVTCVFDGIRLLTTILLLGLLSRSVDVAISKSWTRAAVPRDLWRWSITLVPGITVYGKRYSLSMERKVRSFDTRDSKTCMCEYSVHMIAEPELPDPKMLEVAEGMHYIHSEGIVHGDLRGVS